MTAQSYRILLVDEDPDDRLIAEELLAEIVMWRPDLVTASTYDEGVARALEGSFDIALVDYQLGARRGFEFILEPAVRRADIPVVILAREGGSEADNAAAQAGSADFLSKADLSSAMLERTIRYTVEERRRHPHFQGIVVSPDSGTTFQVLLPLSETAPDAPVTTRRATRKSPPAGGVILLVEDDESVRCLARRILERGGYTVLQAPNGRAALELAASHESAVDVVLSDVIMPDMGGVELKERLRAMYPTLQVILTSGYSEADLRGEIRANGAAFLRKPFSAASLLQIVDETMAGKPKLR